MISFNSDIRGDVRNHTMALCIGLSWVSSTLSSQIPDGFRPLGLVESRPPSSVSDLLERVVFGVSFPHFGPSYRYLLMMFQFELLLNGFELIRLTYSYIEQTFSKNSYPPHEVVCEASRSPSKSKSRNNPILHCCAVFPTWHLFTATPVSGFWQLNQPSVCQKLLSIFWTLERVYTGTREFQIYRCVPDIDISRRFVSKLSTTLLLSPSLSPWTDGRQSMEKRLCTAADLFYSPNRNNSPNMSSHDLQCLITEWKYWRGGSTKQFLNCSSQSFWFEHVPVIFENIFACFAFTLRTSKIFGLLSRANAPRSDNISVRRVLSLQPLPTGPTLVQ